MGPLDVVNLTALMEHATGASGVSVGLIDGPVLINHPDLVSQNIKEVRGKVRGICSYSSSTACVHGTLVAGMLCGRRGSPAPAICPQCSLLVRPIFAETSAANGSMPSATPDELAEAVFDCVNAGARVINLSAALGSSYLKGENTLQQALDYAASRGVISVAAAGNHGTVGASVITQHPWVIPVTACDLQGRPLKESNLGNSIGRRGLMAPGESITSLGTNGKPQIFAGTSAAAPFVTGAIALLWSKFPRASAVRIRFAITQVGSVRRRSIAPPLLDAWSAYQTINSGKA